MVVAGFAGFAWGLIVMFSAGVFWWSRQPNGPPLPFQKKPPIFEPPLPDAVDAASPEPPLTPQVKQSLLRQLAVIEQDTDVRLSPAEREAEANRLWQEFHRG